MSLRYTKIGFGLWAVIVCSFIFCSSVCCRAGLANTRDEPRRYHSGDIKVGHRVVADPDSTQQWCQGTVTKITYMINSALVIDTFTVQCDAAPGQAPRVFKVTADTAHVHRIPVSLAAQSTARTGSTLASQRSSGTQLASRSSSRAVAPRGGPSEEQIKASIRRWLDRQAKQWDDNNQTNVAWTSAVRFETPTRKYVDGIGTRTFYPVKINYTVTTELASRIDVYHWRNGVHEFYRTPSGEWKFLRNDEVFLTPDTVRSAKKN